MNQTDANKQNSRVQAQASPGFDAFVEQWRQPVVVPDDPTFADRVMNRINKQAAVFSLRKNYKWMAAAAVVTVAAGIGLGRLLDGGYSGTSDTNQIVSAAYDLGLSGYETNPYEFLIQDSNE